MFRTSLAIPVLLLLASLPALADEDARLTIGDPAPPLDVAHWIKGVEMDARGDFEPLERFEAGRVYVLDFWATWCPPCRRGMPHLSALQETYADRGVTVVGISDESLPKVYAFLMTEDPDGQRQDDRARYTLGTDPDRSVYRDYMVASGHDALPTAFVVGKDGRIEWIGHPSELDLVLEAVVADTWDRATFEKEFDRQQRVEAAMESAREKLGQAIRAGDWEAVVGVLDTVLAADPGNPRLQLQKLHVLLTRVDDRERAYAYAREVAREHEEEAGLLNMIAWTILDDETVLHPDVDFALELAQRASALENHEDAAILDTVARAFYEKGDAARAAAWQEKAVAKAEDEELRAELARALERYRQAAGAAGAAQPENDDEPGADAGSTSPDAIVGRTWVLTRLGEAGVEGERAPALTFLADGRLAAFGGVNRLMADWSFEEGRLELGPVAGTRMAGPESLMKQEQALVEALGRANAWRVADGVLLLLDGDEVLARFREGS